MLFLFILIMQLSTELSIKQIFLNGVELDRVNPVKDLGVCLDSSLLFNDHYIHIQNRAYSMLGFIIRSCSNF